MTVQEFSQIVKNPDSITLSQVYELENIIHEYPYFQAARAVHLRVLYVQGSYRYNKALKITASHIGDRTLLFDFITSKLFKEAKSPLFVEKKKPSLPKTYYDQAIPKEFTTYVTEDVFEEIHKKNTPKTEAPIEQASVLTPKAEELEDIIGHFVPSSDKNREIEESLQMGKPLDFQSEDKHSFAQWLKISHYKPIQREKSIISEDKNVEKEDKRAKKFDLIDKFLEKNPKIEANRNYHSTIDLADDIKPNEQQLMTETLAKVYLEQGKYVEAIRAYQILILKNPEKSRFFADQISSIRKLQQNNL